MRTEFTTEASFISAFHDLCEESMIFAPTEKMKPVGADCAFSLELADGTPMVRGLGVIRNVWATADSPFGRPGIHIEIDQLTNTSEPIYNRLLAAREAAAHKPRTRPAPSTHQLWGKSSGPPTEEMEAAPEPEEPEIEALPQRITREIRGVADLTDEATPDDDKETKQATRAYARPPTLPGSVPPAPIPRPRLASAPVLPMPTGTTSPPPFGAADSDLAQDLAASRPRAWWMNARVGAVFGAGLALGLVLSLALRGSGDDKRVAVAAAPPPPQVLVKTEPANCPPPAEPAEAALEPVSATAVSSVKASTKVAAPTVAKPTATKASAKPTAVVTTPPQTASKPVARPAPVKVTSKTTTAKPKKPACSSLDCI